MVVEMAEMPEVTEVAVAMEVAVEVAHMAATMPAVRRGVADAGERCDGDRNSGCGKD
jgi:hypothetical protein